MMYLLKTLREDEHGVILSAEIVIIGSVLVIGLITGLTCLQQAVNGELRDVAGAISALDQSYSFSSHRKNGDAGRCCAYTAGSAYYNCENLTDKSCEIVGPCEACPAQGCGDGCVGEAVSGCGICGGRSGGCSACGSGAPGSRSIDTGVPKMKVTEWPGSRYPAENFVQPATESIVVPEYRVPLIQDDVIPPVPETPLVPIPDSLPMQEPPADLVLPVPPSA